MKWNYQGESQTGLANFFPLQCGGTLFLQGFFLQVKHCIFCPSAMVARWRGKQKTSLASPFLYFIHRIETNLFLLDLQSSTIVKWIQVQLSEVHATTTLMDVYNCELWSKQNIVFNCKGGAKPEAWFSGLKNATKYNFILFSFNVTYVANTSLLTPL